MQTLTLSSNGRNGRLLDPKMPARLRAFRFLSERFAQRDRSNYAAEFFLFVLIVHVLTRSRDESPRSRDGFEPVGLENRKQKPRLIGDALT